MSSMGFLFASYVSDMELKKLAIQKHQRYRKKSHKRSLLFLAKGPGKGQPRKTEHLDDNFSPLVKYYRCKLWLLPASKDQVGSLDFCSHQAVTKHPNIPISTLPVWCQRRSGGELGFLYSLVTLFLPVMVEITWAARTFTFTLHLPSWMVLEEA